MGRIEDTFTRLKSGNEKALITYIMAGDPDLDTTGALIETIERAGADILELGVPFSDPVADGPTIQRASDRALKSGTTLKKVISLVKKTRKKVTVPIIVMTYYNIILQYGIERFPAEAVSAGIDGVIIPDLPPEEAEEFIRYAREAGLDTVFLLAPTSTEERIKKVTSVSSGFVYYVSMTGITGGKLANFNEIKDKVSEIQRHTGLPVAVGFGISRPEEARKISRWADGVIVGSAVVRLIEENIGKKQLLSRTGSFVKSLKKGINGLV
ncbi:MAG: tryptophan synthase subunit alpha [Nitrospirae bacterium]|nr:tryptophan synthase subunit alpha [Nitrospirota bacterium]